MNVNEVFPVVVFTGVYLYRMEAFSGGKAIFQDARKLIMLK